MNMIRMLYSFPEGNEYYAFLTVFSIWHGKMHKVKQFVKSKSLSSNLCLDFNKQGIVISQKFSKYCDIQVLIDDSRWLKAEFRDQPSVDCSLSTEVSPQN